MGYPSARSKPRHFITTRQFQDPSARPACNADTAIVLGVKLYVMDSPLDAFINKFLSGHRGIQFEKLLAALRH